MTSLRPSPSRSATAGSLYRGRRRGGVPPGHLVAMRVEDRRAVVHLGDDLVHAVTVDIGDHGRALRHGHRTWPPAGQHRPVATLGGDPALRPRPVRQHHVEPTATSRGEVAQRRVAGARAGPVRPSLDGRAVVVERVHRPDRRALREHLQLRVAVDLADERMDVRAGVVGAAAGERVRRPATLELRIRERVYRGRRRTGRRAWTRRGPVGQRRPHRHRPPRVPRDGRRGGTITWRTDSMPSLVGVRGADRYAAHRRKENHHEQGRPHHSSQR
jgi:hypothetical protein